MTRMQATWPTVAASLAGLLLCVLLGAAWVLAYWSTHPLRVGVPDRPDQDLGAYEDIAFTSRDGLRLSGWLFPARGGRATLILCHGHQFNRTQAVPIMRALRDLPCHFLLFDFRAAGRSQGRVSSIGADERLDIVAAVDWLQTREATAGLPIGVFGYSMGGSAAILAASEDPRIGAVATQGAYASLDRAIAARGRFFLGFLGPLLTTPAERMGRRWLPTDPASVSPARAIGRIAPRPVFIGHGRRDPFVFTEDADILYRSAGEPKELHILQGSWHISVGAADRPAYHKSLRRFFSQALHLESRRLRTTTGSCRTGTT